MKSIYSLPQDKLFYDKYASLIKSVVLAGIFAQIVSGMTESGAIFTSTKASLEPFYLGWWGVLLAGIVAALATLVIEIGLRKTFPVAVDAVLYRRWSGLELWISIFVWLLSVALFTTSGLLSFHNSRVIVDDLTPEAEQQTTTSADSTYQAETAAHRQTFVADSTLIANSYAAKTTSTRAAFDGRIKAKDEKIRGYESREARTGRSYASRKDRTRQERAELEAEKAEALAALEAARADELTQARTNYREQIKEATASRKTATDEVKTANQQAEKDRLANVNKYGGGLGWFTVVCLFLFAVSVVLDRIHRKGAGITESVQIEAYDFRPGALREWWSAITERINYSLHNRITAFANETPSAPLPAQPDAVYDLAEALQHVTIKVELDQATSDEQKIVYLNTKEPEETTKPKRNRIGFNRDRETTNDATNPVDPLYAANHEAETTNHEQEGTTNHKAAETTKESYETTDLRHAKQQLKKYKKRLGSHQQKAIKQERDSGKVCKRTNDAIANNSQWVEHWTGVIQDLSKKSK